MSSHDALDDRIREAFSAEHMPSGLKESTLAMIRGRAQEAPAVCERPAADAGAGQERVPRDADASAKSGDRDSEKADGGALPDRLEPEHSEKDVVTGKVPRRRSLPFKRIAQLMAACLVLSALAVAGFALASETAQVEIVGTESVRLGLNRWGTVVRVECTDAAIRDEVDSLGLFGMGYEDALEKLAGASKLQSLLSQGEVLVLIPTATSGEQQEAILEACGEASTKFAVETTCQGAGNGTDRGSGAGLGTGRGKKSVAGNGMGGGGRGNGHTGMNGNGARAAAP